MSSTLGSTIGNPESTMAPGGVLKRSTRADCKSAGYAFPGSNPGPTTTLQRHYLQGVTLFGANTTLTVVFPRLCRLC